LGVATTTDATRRSAARMAAAYAELLMPQPFEPTDFDNGSGYSELVLARGVPFRSVCAHHLMPFHGVAHVGYLPGERLLGVSKLARAVGFCAAAPQMQEALSVQIVDWLMNHLIAEGAGVVLVAEHGCMTLRGACALGSSVVTMATRGRLATEAGARAEFIALAGARAGAW
jgi:GTP cyclohydrolase I